MSLSEIIILLGLIGIYLMVIGLFYIGITLFKLNSYKNFVTKSEHQLMRREYQGYFEELTKALGEIAELNNKSIKVQYQYSLKPPIMHIDITNMSESELQLKEMRERIDQMTDEQVQRVQGFKG